MKDQPFNCNYSNKDNFEILIKDNGELMEKWHEREQLNPQ